MGRQFFMSCKNIFRVCIFMNIKQIIPTPVAVARETLVTVCGVLIAAWIISKFPTLQTFVKQNSVVVKDENGNVLY